MAKSHTNLPHSTVRNSDCHASKFDIVGNLKYKTHSMEMIIERVDSREIIPLRHRVLRAGLPIATARFEGDGDKTSFHWASYPVDHAYNTLEPIACASCIAVEFNGEPAYKLRGMATDARYRGLGLGTELLKWSESATSEITGIRLFWCNARIEAVRFYEKQGWIKTGDIFHIHDAGPHLIMFKKLI